MSEAPKSINFRPVPKGTFLVEQGARVANIYVIQSGKLALCQKKNEKMNEISHLLSGDCVGDEFAFTHSPWSVSVLALEDSMLIEIPASIIQNQISGANSQIRTLLKALQERVKLTSNELKTLQLARDAIPCPGEQTAKLFGVIFHAARIVGKKADSGLEIEWGLFTQTAFELFDESPFRIAQGLNILAKLGYVSFLPESVDEGCKFTLNRTEHIESFFDFFQNYYFKAGHENLLKTNPKITQITEALLNTTASFPVDRAGNTNAPFVTTVAEIKKVVGNSFEAGHLSRLEQKGLFVKQIVSADGGVLSFQRKEFEQMLLNWKFLREIEIWNENGFVDASTFVAERSSSQMSLEDERRIWAKRLANWKPVCLRPGKLRIRSGKPTAGETWCSICLGILAKEDEYCPVCGVDIKSA